MTVDVLEDAGQVAAGDVVILGISAGTGADIVDLALALRTARGTVIALTQLPFETDPRIPREHPSGRLLHEVADAVIDLGGPFGDGEFTLPASGVAILPTSGVTGILAMWMMFAEAVGLMLAAGTAPLMFESNLLPGARQRNEERRQAMAATGLGYGPIDRP
jgi:uncharacterized phosphosugar-binding protein